MNSRSSATTVRTVACPGCGAPVRWEALSAFRPFCSARCKEADIGAWASERYRVAGTDDNTEQGADGIPDA